MPLQLVDAWPERSTSDDADDPTLVGQWEWCRLIPRLHRTLANPLEHVLFPRLHKDCERSHACAYWETAYYLLRRLVGWRDVGAGLQWWFRQDKPVDDERLALLKTVWDDRDQLVLLALWAWRNGFTIDHTIQERQPEDFLGEDFYKNFLRRFPASGVVYDHDPYWGGTNPLHLGHSMHSSPDPEALLLRHADKPHASVVLERARGWHATLDRLGRTLPRRSDHDWRVHVVVRAIGSFGVFRLSTQTNEWFQGKHSVHAAYVNRSSTGDG